MEGVGVGEDQPPAGQTLQRRQQVPAQVGRPSDKVGSRTAPVFRAPQPESAPVGLEDGPAYTEEQKAALRAFLEGED